ncbi:ribokinase [Aurantibacter crassamenti]|uniref:ribokinase n=1 Tax=Aurantibacter crassamenti TaxID=1837375 RepID=UPI001939ABD4|nr:ribokinase [Aurantibacter crassamenti]MBM1107783.1 ribokinase [Aurantibacter crassamenti]
MSKIVVVGSSNTDMVVKTERFPKPGETIIGGDFYMFSGGKGANQAVAAARLGGDVSFICCVGDDVFGKNALVQYKNEGIDVDAALIKKDTASGVALITVNASGENEIVVASGANAQLNAAHLDAVESIFSTAKIVLTQLEVPMETVEALAEKCKTNKLPLIINPAPAAKLSAAILKGLYLITPNETETFILTGIEVTDVKSAKVAGNYFLEQGVQNVIITMGSQGAFFMNAETNFLMMPPKVNAVDTTAAGDVFNGALTTALAQGDNWEDSIKLANKAAALSVTKLGAQISAPTLEEIK